MKRYKVVGGVVSTDAGGWVRYDDARAVIDGLQALLNERDAEIDRLRGAQVEDAPEGATHFVVRRWFRINGEGWQFLNEYGRWQTWTSSYIKGLTAIARAAQ